MTNPRTWLITGASGGLGLALVRRVLADGDRVVATSRSGSLPLTDPHLSVLTLDPADAEACRRVVAEAERLGEGVDVLVNNAGYGLVGAIEEVDEAEARAILDVDLLAPLWLSRAVIPGMRERGRGEIVQVSSVGAVGSMPFLGLYNAAKWGLEGFSGALAAEVAPWGIGVTIAEIGAMDTAWATAGMAFSAPRPEYDELRAQTLGTAEVPWPSEPGATGGGSSPEAIAEGIVVHLARQDGRPLRLVLGDDAPGQIEAALEMRRQDYARQSGFRGDQD